MDLNRRDKYVNTFQTAGEFVKELVKQKLFAMKYYGDTPLNVNVLNKPAKDLEGARITEPGFRRYSEEIIERRDFRDRKYYWIGGTTLDMIL